MTTSETLNLLRDYESQNVLFDPRDGSWPIVWERAKGTEVWDAGGKKYLDLTAAFGVASAGHANPNVIKAGQKQMARLLHAMGDVHPHARKAELARELSRLTYERWTRSAGKTIFCNSGFEAVEVALKTALLATGKRGVLAFTGSYHGVGYGALNVTHRSFFRRPFLSQLRDFGKFAPFPNWRNDLATTESLIWHFLRRKRIGAVIVEPIQARGGMVVPPPEFLPLLRRMCDEFDALLIVDEIYTGFGRTGKWFACEHRGAVPDIVCLGKALAGGFPIAACVGKADLMDDAWPASEGEAIHTSTFLGHPVGCAMALAQIKEIQRLNLCEKSEKLGSFLLSELDTIKSTKVKGLARGLGLMAGLELTLAKGKPATAETFTAIKQMLKRGYILLPEGRDGNVIGFTPPLTITKAQLAKAVKTLEQVLVAG
jgi:4-aminobutyrate aminotransferase-like enzyme